MTGNAESRLQPGTATRLLAWRPSALTTVELGLPLAAALATAAATCFTLWFFESEPNLDALGLFNPAYTALKTGHTTYPVYAYPTDMVIHPPTHYWILAQIMRVTGMSAEAAALVPVGFWVTVAAFLIASSRWRVGTKAALLLATWLSITVWAPATYIRPDAALAAAWITGLAALETGRVGGWRLWRLGIGSFAVAFASTLHYPASLAGLAVVPYAAWAAVSLCGRARVRVVSTVVVPAVAVLLAYALIFVLPHLADIRYVTSHQNAQGSGIFAAFDQTRQTYEFFANGGAGGSVLAFLLWPIFRWGVPAALVAPPVLAFFRPTRGLAVASLPYLLTLLFYAKEKTGYYYTPDVFIYLAALGMAVFTAAERLARRVTGPRSQIAALGTSVAVLCAAVAVGASAQPALAREGAFTWHPLHADMDIARAAGAQMIPADGTVATNDVALWYVTGANRVYYPRDWDEALTMKGAALDSYFSGFDAVAEESYDTWTTENAQDMNISSLFASGVLHVKGFYFGRGWSKGQPTIVRYLLLSPQRTHLRGFAWGGDSIYRFSAGGAGAYALIGARCSGRSPALPGTAWQTSIYLPGAADNTLTIERDFKVAVVGPGARGQAWATLQAAGCRRAFEEPLRLDSTTPVRAFLAAWRDNPRSRAVIRFPQAAPAITTRLYRPMVPTRVASTVDLATVTNPFTGPATIRTATGIQITSPTERFTSLFSVPLADPNAPRAWIRIRLEVVAGMVQLCAQDTTKQGCMSRVNVGAGPPRTIYLSIGSPNDHPGLYVDNRGGVAASVQISSIQLLEPRR